MIGTRIANFQITQELGTGGMGTVYKAKDLNLNRYVALKMLHNHILSNSNSFKRFKNEAQISAQISHANVAMLYDFIEIDKKSYIIMEYVDGHTLEKELEIKKQLSELECINYTIQTLKGLSEAHDLDILHRDLKPSNLMIKKNGYVKLMDFGIARMENSTRLTAQNKVVGTIEYMAPEILKGQDPNRTSDLYAIGVMMHEMLTGKTLYKSQSDASLMYQIVNEKPQYDLGNVNSGLARIIKKMVKKNPQQRYRTTLEVITDLENVSRSILAKSNSSKISLPNIELSKFLNLIKKPSFLNSELNMTKGMKFVLFSVFLSLGIVVLGSLFSGNESKQSIEPDVKPSVIIDDYNDNQSRLAFDNGIQNNSYGEIETDRNPSTTITPNDIEVPVPQPKQSDSSNDSKDKQKEVRKPSPKSQKSKQKNKGNESIEIPVKPTPESNTEVDKSKVDSNRNDIENNDVLKSSEIENNKQEKSNEINDFESIEIESHEVNRKSYNLYLEEQYLPVVASKLINSSNYSEGDIIEFRTAKSVSIDQDIVINKNAPVRVRVSRKKIKNNGKVIFAMQIESVQTVDGQWVSLSYPEYSDIKKGEVIIPAHTTIKKVKIKSQQITIFK